MAFGDIGIHGHRIGPRRRLSAGRVRIRRKTDRARKKVCDGQGCKQRRKGDSSKKRERNRRPRRIFDGTRVLDQERGGGRLCIAVNVVKQLERSRAARIAAHLPVLPVSRRRSFPGLFRQAILGGCHWRFRASPGICTLWVFCGRFSPAIPCSAGFWYCPFFMSF